MGVTGTSRSWSSLAPAILQVLTEAIRQQQVDIIDSLRNIR